MGNYILIRALGDGDQTVALRNYLYNAEVGSFSMTEFELVEDESPSLIARRLILAERDKENTPCP